MKKTFKNSAIGLLVCFALVANIAKAQNIQHGKVSDDELMKWFREAKFGMFIHFGSTTPERLRDTDMTRTEKYEAGVREFNPVDFDAKEWVRIAKEGGMKYIVFTTKHHDGFCKWDSDLTDWDVMDQSIFKRDIVGELAEACKEAGIRLGFYYSIADWHHPEYDAAYSNRNGFHFNPNPNADITKYMHYMYAQIRELCEKYQPSLFWFDGSAGFRAADRKRLLGQQEMVDMLNSYGAICNSRYGDDDDLKYVNYVSMGDNMKPSGNIGLDFESAGTMNESWHFNSRDKDWKSKERLLSNLVDIIGFGGNYLLNVGPDDKGIIPEASVSGLKAMGDWLKKNGEAIYGTKANPHPHDMGWGSITQRQEGKNTKLFLNVVDWPKNGVFKVYGLNNKVTSASLLASGTVLNASTKFNAEAGLNVLSIEIPETAPDPYVSVIALNLEGTVSMNQELMQHQDGTVLLDGYQSTIRDKEFISEKLLHPLEHRVFTITKGDEGIKPTYGMTIGGLKEVGQALSWDFRLVEPGTYEVAVVSMINSNTQWKADGRMRANVAGQSVENKLIERERLDNPRMAQKLMNSVAILGTVTIDAPGMQTLSLEVSSDFEKTNLRLRRVMLLPLEKKE